MLTLHYHPETEALFEQLYVLLKHASSKPLERIPFLIQGRGMERWLQMRLSERMGVFAQGDFLFPVHFFNQTAQRLGLTLSKEDLDREVLRWRIDDVLQTMVKESSAPSALAPFLRDSTKRFALAMQLANMFDQYQIMRPELLKAWSENRCLLSHPHEAWQMQIWQALKLNLKSHRGELWQTLIETLLQAPENSLSAQLPSQVFVFGISFMPELMLQVLDALSRHIPVHLMLLSPTVDFWGDLPGKKEATRLQVFELDNPFFADTNFHPLLINLAQQGAHFQNLLLDLETLELGKEKEALSFRPEKDQFEKPASTLLTQLQQDIVLGKLPKDTKTVQTLEKNIEFHRCHTPLRELEVARERILGLLHENATLTPADIVVVSPDMTAYRPYISTVFSDLPHSIADRATAVETPSLQSMSLWLKLLRSGHLGWDAVFDFLSREDVSTGLGITPGQLMQLRQLVVEQAQVRCELESNRHRNSWLEGAKRLLLGAIMETDRLWQDTAPIQALEGQSIHLLTPLLTLLELLQTHQSLAREPKPLDVWLDTLEDWAKQLYAHAPEHTHQPVHEALSTLKKQYDGLDAPLDLDMLSLWADTLAEEKRSSSGFLAHGITFCDLLPMRAIPARVVIMLGMNDQAWPRPHHPADYDLMAAFPRRGDRLPRQEDRYTFLEILMGVRDRLIITWQGLSADKNTRLPPAQVVVELRDVLSQHYGVQVEAKKGEDEKHTLTRNHKAFPYHSRYYTEHDDTWCQGWSEKTAEMTRRLHETAPTQESFLNQPPALEPPDPLPLFTLQHACGEPVKWWLTQQQLQADETLSMPDARPVLAADGLTRWQMRQQHQCNLDEAQSLQTLRWQQAEGTWPPDPVGTTLWQAQTAPLKTLKTVADTLRETLGDPLPPNQPLLEIDAFTLQLQETQRHTHGWLHCQPHRLKGKHMLNTWLAHLAACSLQPAPTHLLYLEQHQPHQLCFKKVSQDEAKTLLSEWLMQFKTMLNARPWLFDAEWLFDDKKQLADLPHWHNELKLKLGLRTDYNRKYVQDADFQLLCDGLSEQAVYDWLEETYHKLSPLLEAMQNHMEIISHE